MKYAWVLVLAPMLGGVIACDDTPTKAPWKQDVLSLRIEQLGSADRYRELRVKGTIAAPFEVSGSAADRTITFLLVDGKATVRVVTTHVVPYNFSEHMIGTVVGRLTDGMLRADDVFVSAPDFPVVPKAPSP